MNPNYAQRIKENLDKLLDTQWLSPLVIILKKNGKLQICVYYHKLNSQTKKFHFFLSFLDSILDTIVKHKMYSFMDGYNGYNQVKMAKENNEKRHLSLNGEHMPTTLCLWVVQHSCYFSKSSYANFLKISQCFHASIS